MLLFNLLIHVHLQSECFHLSHLVTTHIVEKLPLRPYNVRIIKNSRFFSQVNPITAAFYDSILMYGIALNETLTAMENPKDGRIIARKLWNKTFLNGIQALQDFT